VDISTTMDLKCFKSGYKKKPLQQFYRDTQRRDFRALEDKNCFRSFFYSNVIRKICKGD
jgi:hypothetical protein